MHINLIIHLQNTSIMFQVYIADWHNLFGLVGKEVDDKAKMPCTVFYNKVIDLQTWAGADSHKWQRIANLDKSIPTELPSSFTEAQ